ncbi:M56 family metallopeptidase [Engelhardtia mirabilis]|uniref:Regulatory protein BlaR1 n=1 Tax=Engelhardtia mirabilis TaxID=2528011 RepID=A0A518BS51_9BACT|nr:Regulatory protein BlaR1 [Planctomycetes bacterium Pla133]QDV04125.1 Regulatory protein BlaR1 [Planctomycetes bacterium Pla86]
MSWLDSVAPELLGALWRTSWQVALLVAGVLAIEALLGRSLTARWRYRLWLLVFVRLLLPAPIAIEGGLVPWTSMEDDLGRRTQQTPDANDAPSHAPLTIGPRPRAVAPAPEARSAGVRTVPGTKPPPERPRRAAFGGSSDGRSGGGFVPGTVRTPTDPLDPIERFGSTTVAVWLAGLILCLLRLAAGALRLRGRIARASRVDEPRLLAALDDAARRAGLAHAPRVRCLPTLSGPAVVGVLRPTLIVPPDLVSRLAPADLERVLLHELFHVRSRDVAVNLAAAIAGAAFWFHPLVYLARVRLRAAQESARDWQALDAAQAAPIGGYARALVDLSQGRHSVVPSTALPLSRAGRDLERRILMIDSYKNRPHRSWLVGAPLVLALAWTGLTDAAVPAVLQREASEAAWREIPVQAVRTEPAWAQELRQRLNEPAAMPPIGEGATSSDVIEMLRAALGVNIVMHQDARTALEEIENPRLRGASTGAEILDRLVRQVDSDYLLWCLTGHAIYIAPTWQAPDAFDLRLYDIGPLLDLGYELDEIEEYIVTATWLPYLDWDQPWVSIDRVGRTFAISHTSSRHEEIRQALERLLNGGRRPPGGELSPSILESLTDELIELHTDDATTLGETADWLSQTLDVDILISDGYQDDEAGVFDLIGVPASDAIAWLARAHGLNIVEQLGGIELREMPGGDVETEFFRLDAVVRSVMASEGEAFGDEYPEWAYDEVTNLLRSQVQPDYWDQVSEAAISRLGDFLMVRATPQVLGQVRQLLASLEAVSR